MIEISSDKFLYKKQDPDGKLKFPVTFHEGMSRDLEKIEENIFLSPPKKKEKKVTVVELKNKNKDKKGLF